MIGLLRARLREIKTGQQKLFEGEEESVMSRIGEYQIIEEWGNFL